MSIAMRLGTIVVAAGMLVPAARGGGRLDEEVAKLVAPKIDGGDAVGIVVGVVRDRRTEVLGFGRVEGGVDRAPDGKTIFEIGSITKVFTSLALADMAREGLVRVDDPVAKYLPEGVRVPDREGKPITLRTLSNHTSGLPRVMPRVVARALTTGDPYSGISPDDLYAFLGSIALTTTPGETFAYSNVGGGLLGLALARRAGTSYEDLVLSRVCRPLGMSDTRVALDPWQSAREARPHAKAGKPEKAWHFDALAGAGALHSTADDLLAFARAQLDLAPAPARLREAMRDMRAKTAAAGPGHEIGLGWIILPAGERPVAYFHNGGTGGYRSYLAIAPSARAAVVVLSNSTSEMDSIGEALLKLVAAPGGAE